jgi:hypothetical protein
MQVLWLQIFASRSLAFYDTTSNIKSDKFAHNQNPKKDLYLRHNYTAII